jgi:hypothetical protein
LGVLALVCGPALAGQQATSEPPGTSACGSGGVDSHGDPCVDGKTTAGAADKTPFNGSGGGSRGSGGGHGR